MDYGSVIRRGFDIAWNNKYLWVLGFLAALTGGSGSNNLSYSTSSGDVIDLTPGQMAAIGAGILAFICLALVVGIVLWFVSLASRGGIIQATASAEAGETLTLGSAFRAGWSKVWSLAGMTLLLYGLFIVGIIVLLVLAFTSGGLAVAAGLSGDNDMGALMAGLGTLAVCLIGLACLLIPIYLIVSFIYPFAFRGLVLRNLRVTDAIRHGWRVLVDNLGPILILAILFFIINLVVWAITGIILAPLGVVLLGPLGDLFGGGAASGASGVARSIVAVAGLLVMLVIAAVIAAFLVVWQSATFTVAYLRFTEKGPVEKVVEPAM
jgi:hypothetical protein